MLCRMPFSLCECMLLAFPYVMGWHKQYDGGEAKINKVRDVAGTVLFEVVLAAALLLNVIMLPTAHENKRRGGEEGSY